MKKARKEKKEKPEGPVPFNRSIMAAFEKQIKGKVCPLCNEQFSLAAYRSHMDICKLDENDDEIAILATYSREEAVLLRAGPEIVLGEEESAGNAETAENFENAPDFPKTTPKTSNPVKRRRTEKNLELEIPKSPLPTEPSTSVENVAEKLIKSSPAWENRRRSARVAKNAAEKTENVVKKENAKISEVLEAIEKFEARIAESEHSWPYYMKYTVRIIKRVVSTRKFDGTYYSDDFWSPDDVITIFRFVDQTSEAAKCLLCRLFIRKHGWYHLEKLEQKYPEIPEIAKAAVELTKWQFIEDDCAMNSLEQALALSDIPVLKNVAKKFKIDCNQNKQELVQSLRKFAQSQKSIFGGSGNVEKSLLRSVKQELGTCIRIKNEIVDLFKAFFTIYCPVTTNSANSIDNPGASNVYQELLYMMLSVENGSVKFPAPNPCPNISSFYSNRTMLYDYTSAKSLETTLVVRLSTGNLESAFDLALSARDLIATTSDEQKRAYERLEVHERKFTAIWVLTRCCGHGATVLEKQKKWGMAVEWHKWTLANPELKMYCLDSRGVWWDRMLLNLDTHLKEKKECARMVLEAMRDDAVLDKELLLIQDRALRLKELGGEFRVRLSIGQPAKRTISAATISKSLGDGRVNRFVIRNGDEDVEASSVEEVVRHRLIHEHDALFTHGVHDEGATWHTLFGLLFYDVIFPDDVTSSECRDTWLSEVQDAPSDLSNSLYAKRRKAFDERFEWLEEAENEHVEEVLRKIWHLKKEETNRECAWKLFARGADDCLSLFNCIPRRALLEICRRLAKNYRNCRSGFPDLTMWNPETKTVAVVEVKGPGDRLSTKQRLWLAFFAEHGIRAEVCHVTPENSKRLS